MKLLKWKVTEAPTGRYRSFQRRGWPTGYLADDKVAAHIMCEDEYQPSYVKSGNHKPLTVRVAQHNLTDDERKEFGGFRWRSLKKTCATFDEAKSLAEEFFKKNLNF